MERTMGVLRGWGQRKTVALATVVLGLAVLASPARAIRISTSTHASVPADILLER